MYCYLSEKIRIIAVPYFPEQRVVYHATVLLYLDQYYWYNKMDLPLGLNEEILLLAA